MTRTPEYHYRRADELVAELEQADPQVALKLPSVAFKMRLAELHAQLANSPWWPGVEAACEPTTVVDFSGHTVRIDTRTTNGDLL
ncbi:hypothetical protein SEA_SKINNYPETE_47 [Mycobacterium phage SkinnyPete]|uniref:Uncharacterized protein n=1 Tax=Mycobacterium phage SkinnyPete TaxID=1821539 RepID=A0A142ULH3_9CAUD|nr:hypothetical protein FDG99_gp47 [Mycobacterium phage SkinnyPete]AMU78477.1 hypothetical protein SEA_SKINNYPETE_47 [Mycobacterium phage SkinnyPete]